MSWRVFKYPLRVTDVQTVPLPVAARPLSVQIQRTTDDLTLWALVSDAAPVVPREVYVVGTGRPADHVVGCDFLGTLQDGPLVWHVFITPER